MLCHIVQNGGCIFLILCLWVSIASSVTSKSSYTIQEFCSGNLFIRTIEPGEPYQLTLRSEGTSANKNKWYQKTKRKCVKEFKTSDPAAHLEISITNMTIPSCSGLGLVQSCRCNYLEISVLGHKNRYCGNNETGSFSSKSDTITIEFQHAFTRQFDATLIFIAERNSYIISGTPSEHSYNAGTFLETPYFPLPYPPNYRAEYTLQSSDVNGHVVLLFLDFQISNQSFIEVVGNNGSRPTRFYGSTFRPPVIVSQSNYLELKFESNTFGMKGFRGLSYFVKTVDSLSVPYTDCGGLKNERVGNMDIKTHQRFSLYDCMWLYLPYLSLKSNISIFVQLRDISHKSMLEFRSGDNSKSVIIKVINCESENCSNLNQEMTLPASDNLYIRFRGYLDVYSIVNMSYSTFHTGNCSDREFLCEDGRCLLMNSRCDGIKQCPSGIDEEQCPVAVVLEAPVTHPTIKRENFHNTVYKKFFVIVLVGSFGLVAVFIAVLIFMYKFHKTIADNIEQAQAQHIIGEMSGVSPTLYPANLYCNDNPPSYEDFMKSSECYPPLLYTRAKQRYMPKEMCSQCTTSFTVSARPRYHSADSSSYRSSETNSDIFMNNLSTASEQACSNFYNVEIFNCGACKTSNSIRKWYSLDSKLNDLAKEDTCHVFLSIIHPVCNHTPNRQTHVQCHTLPPNFKMSPKCTGNIAKMEEVACVPSNSNMCGTRDRRCTWSFAPYNSHSSEILTLVKPRCCSDPCNGIKVHYSVF